MKRIILGALALIAVVVTVPTGAQAQSTCPAIITGAILTQAQWQSCFTAKQDYLGFVPLNPSSIVGIAPITATPTAGVVDIAMIWTGLNLVTTAATPGSWWSDVGGDTANPIFNVRDRLGVDDGALMTTALGAGTSCIPSTRGGTAINSVGGGWAKVSCYSSLYVLGSIGLDSISGQAVTSLQTGGPASNLGVGILGMGLSNNTSQSETAWGGYFEGLRTATLGWAYGIEIAVGNTQSVQPISIYGSTTEITTGLQIDCGGAAGAGTTYTNCSGGLYFITNHGSASGTPVFDRGIIFGNNSVADQGGGVFNAVNFPNNYRINWWRNNSSADQLNAFIAANNTNTGQAAQSLTFGAGPLTTLATAQFLVDGGTGAFVAPSVAPMIHVGNSNGSSTLITLDTFGSSVLTAFVGELAAGTRASPTAAPSATAVVALAASAYDGTSAYGTLGDVRIETVNQTSPTDHSGLIRFRTVATGAFGTPTSRATIQNGMVIGSPTGGDEGAGTLNVTGLYINGTLEAFPASGLLVGTTDAQSLTNKTITASTNVLGGVTMTLGSDAEGDIYYRHSGVLTRVPIGSSGQGLEVVAGIPSWQTFAGTGTVISVSITGSGGNAVSGTCPSAITITGTCQIAAPGGFLNFLRGNSMSAWFHGCVASACTITTAGGWCAEGVWIIPTGASVTCQQTSTTIAGSLFNMKITGNTSVTDVIVRYVVESYTMARFFGKNVTFQMGMFNQTGGTVTPTLQSKFPTAGVDNWGGTNTIDLAATNMQPCTNSTNCTEAYTLAVTATTANGYEFNQDIGNNFSTTGKSVTINFFDARIDNAASTGLNSNPPPFEVRDASSDIVWSQRFYQTDYDNGILPGTATRIGMSGTGGVEVAGAGATGNSFRTVMRCDPSVSVWDGAGNANKASTFTAPSTWTDNFVTVTLPPSTAGHNGFPAYIASSENAVFHYAADCTISGG